MRVVLFGDSLIYGSGLDDAHAMPAVIARDRPDLDVRDEGLPGAAAGDLLADIRLATSASPAVVVLWIGTNDALQGVPVAQFADELGRLVDGLGPARVVLVTPVQDASAPQAYRPYARASRALAQARALPLVDLDGQLQPADFLPDGAHLTALAEQRVAGLIEQAIPRGA